MLDAWELKLEILVLGGTQCIGIRLVGLPVRQSHRVPVAYSPHNPILSQIRN